MNTVLLAYSAQVARPKRFTHLPSGTEVVIIPAPRRHRWARSLHRRHNRRALRPIASYLSLPVLATLRELRYWGARAILTQEYEHARFDLLVLLGKVARLPVFASFQSGNAPLSKLERPVRPYAARTAAGLIIAPHAERERVHHAYGVPRSQIHPIPNTFEMRVDDVPDLKAARAGLHISNAATVIVWHGRVSINAKGLDVLLDAWERVRHLRDGQELLLLLVGSGADGPRLHAEIAARTIDNITWRDQFLLDRDALLPYLCATRNRGIREAKGRYVAFLDSDDVWNPEKLKEQVAIMQNHPEVGLLFGASLYWWSWAEGAAHEDKVMHPGADPDVRHDPQALLLALYPLGRGISPCPSSCIARRDVIEQIGGFEEQFRTMYEDQAFLTKAYLSTPVWISSRCWDRYRRHPGAITLRTGEQEYHRVRRTFLSWLDQHLTGRKLPIHGCMPR